MYSEYIYVCKIIVAVSPNDASIIFFAHTELDIFQNCAHLVTDDVFCSKHLEQKLFFMSCNWYIYASIYLLIVRLREITNMLEFFFFLS